MSILLFVSLFTVHNERCTPLFAPVCDATGYSLGRLLRVGVSGYSNIFLVRLRFLRPFERVHGIAHVMIFWGALVVTFEHHPDGRAGIFPGFPFAGFRSDQIGLTYIFLKDLFSLSIMAGCIMAFCNRVFFRPARMILSLEALIILNWIFWMMVMDLLYEGTLFILSPDHPESQAAFLGVIGKNILDGYGTYR